MTNDKKCIAMLSLITPVFFNTTLLRMRYLSFDDSLDMGELKEFILWCVNKIGEILNKSLNLQAKERVNLNALKRIENPHHETPVPLYSINDGCKTAFPTIISEEMVVFGNHVSTFFLYLILKEPLKKAGLRSKQASDIYYSKIEMSVSKQQFAKVHGIFNRFQLFLKNAFDVDLLSAINFQKIAFLNFSLEGIIGAVAQAAIYITGGALILGHQLSIGGFVVIVVYFAYVTNAIKRIFSLNENYQLARAAHERLQEYLCMPLSTDGGLTTLEILSIEYKAVGFSFGERFQLSNINLAFRKGTLYGLCGKNGSGKTTLMLLLLGIYPNYRGEILINGINQKQYNLKKLRSCVIHYTEQTPVFFDEPMVKNFELFEGERRPFLQVKTYIQMLGLHNIVSLEDDALRFSEHYQYSAGELAKIAILRSLVLKKSVYIWDEPDTALDEAAKQALIKILKELSNEAIVVIITHNSDLLNACETIYHL